MTATLELTAAERHLLKYIHAKLGRRAKTLIRQAWETGSYDSRLVYNPNDESLLQGLRNSHGPSWLNNVSLAQI